MHISEGILSAPVLFTGAAAASAGVAIGLKKMSPEKVPEVAVLSSAFFVASLVHVPLGPSSVHLVLNGLVGVLLGWMAFPSILVALILQALLFQFGGFTVLGVNTVNMALPAVISYYLFSAFIRKNNYLVSAVASFCAGAVGIGGGALLIALCLVTTGEGFTNVARLILITHSPVMLIEGLITSFCVMFIKKVKPELLEVHR